MFMSFTSLQLGQLAYFRADNNIVLSIFQKTPDRFAFSSRHLPLLLLEAKSVIDLELIATSWSLLHFSFIHTFFVHQ